MTGMGGKRTLQLSLKQFRLPGAPEVARRTIGNLPRIVI
jgi:hypothetical protein